MKLKRPGTSTGHDTGAFLARDLHAILEDGRNRKRLRGWLRSAGQRRARAADGLTSRETGLLDGRGRSVPRRKLGAHRKKAATSDLSEGWRRVMRRLFGVPLGMDS